MRRLLAGVICAMALGLTGCGSSTGDVSQVTISLGESGQHSVADLQAAADAVLARFGEGFAGCTLLRLTYDENFSTSQVSLATKPLPSPDADVVVFDSSFSVDWRGQDLGMAPNSTYESWTWTVTRSDPSDAWTVTNWGVA